MRFVFAVLLAAVCFGTTGTAQALGPDASALSLGAARLVIGGGALGRWQDALFGLAAITNAAIGVVQEYRAKRSLDRLALLHAPRARVVRDGAEQVIAVREVVQDDLVVLRAGDQVTADGRVLDGVRLEVDESLLTGESEPIAKEVGDDVLSGSIVVGGEGRVRVTAVGDDAFAARLTAEAKRFSLVNSELRGSIDRILKWITWAIFPIMLIVVNANMQAAGGWQHAIETGEWRDAAVASVAAVIAMIPLGLVLMTSIAFAVGAVKLGARQVLVQELPAVEGLARVDLICLDKTGTITTGDVRFAGEHPLGDAQPEGWRTALAWNGAQPDANATARGLADEYPLGHQPEVIARIEFSSDRKWSAGALGAGAPGTWVLGAPEFVLAVEGPNGDAAADDALGRARVLAESG
ncbi:MAG TPA: HAD-IC family P-type ATPase, partial [Agromyces sp.]